MKFKKTRKERKCYECKSFINKGDLYGQRSIALGEKVDGESQIVEGMYTVVHYMRIPVDMCQCCLEKN